MGIIPRKEDSNLIEIVLSFLEYKLMLEFVNHEVPSEVLTLIEINTLSMSGCFYPNTVTSLWVAHILEEILTMTVQSDDGVSGGEFTVFNVHR
jgi:hypothetical protein